MDNFDPSEPLPWLSEPVDDAQLCDEVERFIASLNDPLNSEDNPQPLPPSFDMEEVVALPSSGTVAEKAVVDAADQFLEYQSDTVASGSLDCSGCVLLREVVHTNGFEDVRLAIHGSLGVFYHAVVEVTDSVDGLPAATGRSAIDLRAQSFEQVKQFLIDYGQSRAQDGYALVQDSLSSFFDALCVSLNLHIAITSANINEPQLPQQEAVNDPFRTEKTGLSAQRERTANLHVSDLADYFHLRIVDASKHLGICPTVLKKTCRKYGMRRWPYRKVNSIDCKIKKLQDDLISHGGHGAVIAREEIEKLIAQRARICCGLHSS